MYAVHYEGEEENEYERLMELWTDVAYLRAFAKQNRIENIKKFVGEVSEDAEDIQDFMDAVEDGEEWIDSIFKALYNQEMGMRVLSLQKGRSHRKSHLRLYAIRIDGGTYLIRGGAIKLVRTMQESEELMIELGKLNTARAYLVDEGVFDYDSFQEFKTEQDED